VITFLKAWNKNNFVALVRKRTIRPSDRRLSPKLVPTLRIEACRVVSAADAYDRNFGVLFMLHVLPDLFFRILLF
jgi:hypothetical protein